MKLLNKTIVYYLSFALPLFAVCSVSIYYFISSEIKEELDENMLKEKTEIEQKIKKGIAPELISNNDISIREYSGTDSSLYYFSDTSLYSEDEQEFLPYRVLNTFMHPGNKNYQLSIRHSYVESEDLVFSILLPIISLFIILLAGFLFINYWISKKLWSPFYKTIGKLETFELKNENTPAFPSEKIIEFDTLNKSLNIMTKKAFNDYLKQKEFTENASHEIQTPLAVIRNKIELLIQSKQLGDEEMKLISGIYDSAGRLSHLNKTLLLLARIDNHQFTGNRPTELKEILEKCLEQYQEHAAHKGISIKIKSTDHPVIFMDPVLCETLFNNLLMNAIRHNTENGSIEIELSKNKFVISNTGNPITISPESMFERFRKDSSASESTGLGLSIVRSICDLYAISIDYTFTDKKHVFTLTWQAVQN